jgi:uncharacterized protein YjbJ (UPF0337 family)
MERKKDLIQELAERRLEKKKDALNVDFKDKFSPKTAKKKTPVNYLAKFSEEVENDSPIFKSILRKTNETGIDLDILGEVYNRGYNSWDETKNVSPEQYAFARLNSYINQGKTYFEEDKDLHEGYKIRSKGFENVEVVHKGRVIHRCKDPHSARMFIANHNKELKESALEESKNTPYVRPFHAIDNPDVQVGWKASNKHGKVKWFGKDFKSAAHKHAGIAEEIEINEGQFTKVMVSRSSMGAGARFASSHADDSAAKRKYGLTDNWNKVRGLPRNHPPTYYKDGKYYHFLKEELNESNHPTRTFHVGVIMNRKSPGTKERESKTLRFTFEHPDTPGHTQPDGKYGHDWHPSNVQQMLDSNKSYSKHSKDGWSHGDNSMHYSTKKEKVDEFLAAKAKDPHKYITIREELDESWGVKTKSFKDFKNGAQEWADNHTHDGKVEFHTKEVGVGDKKWHQTIASSPHHDYRIGHFNHSGKGKSEEGSGQHLHWSDSGMDESVELDEGKMKDLAHDLEHMANGNFKQKYGKTKQKLGNAVNDPAQREDGSSTVVRAYKADTPGEVVEGYEEMRKEFEDNIDKHKNEHNKLSNYHFDKAKEYDNKSTLNGTMTDLKNLNKARAHRKACSAHSDAASAIIMRSHMAFNKHLDAHKLTNQLTEAVKRGDKAPVLIPTHTDEYGNTIPAKTVMRKSGKQIIRSGDLTNGRPG